MKYFYSTMLIGSFIKEEKQKKINLFPDIYSQKF